MYSSLFNLIGCGKSCCTRRHDTSHNYEFGIMAKQDRTNLLSVCPLLNSYDKMLSVKRSYMHTCHFIRVEQFYFFSVTFAKVAFVLDYTSKFPVSFCRISNISLKLTSLFGGYAHSGYSHLVFNPLINSGCYDLHQAKIGYTNNQA